MDTRQWLERARIRPPEPRRGREAAFARNYRRFSTLLLAMMLPLELWLLFHASPMAVLPLLASTFALVTIVARGYEFAGKARVVAVEAAADRQTDRLLRDAETGMPNRQYLVEELTRDMARTVRYGEPLTLAVLRIEGLDRLGETWGEDVVERAGQHVADTLRRISRASDFTARLDESRFAALLVQCDRRQAAIFIDRATLAVANRPLRPAGRQRLPIYISIEAQATQFDPERFRGPLEFLSCAGADLDVAPAGATGTPRRPLARGDARNLRRQLIHERDVDGVIGRVS